MKPNKYAQLLFGGAARNRGAIVRKLREEDRTTIAAVLRKGTKEERELLLGGPGYGRRVGSMLSEYETLAARSLATEVQWIAIALLLDIQKLKAHLDGNNVFLRLLLRGEHDAALNQLIALEKEFGVSQTTQQAYFALQQQAGGLAANRSYLAKVRPESRGLYTALLDLCSQRVEVDCSYAQFASAIAREVGYAETLSQTRDLARWVRFRVCSLSSADLREPQRLLWGEEQLPHIDRYHGLVRVLQMVLSARKAERVDLPDILRDVASSLFEVEPELTWILLAANAIEAESVPVGPFEIELNDLVEAYTKGEYDRVSERSAELIVADPTSIELYELYANSSAHLKRKFVSPLPEASFGDLTLGLVHACVQRRDHATSALMIAKLATVFDSSRYGRQLAGFALAQNRLPTNMRPAKLSALAATTLTPRFAVAFGTTDKTNRFLARFPHPFTKSVYECLLERDPSRLGQGLPESRRYKYEGTALLASGRADPAVEVFQKLLACADGVAPIEHAAKSGLIRAYIAQGRPSDAAKIAIEEWVTESKHLDSLPLNIIATAMENGPAKPDIVNSLFWRLYFDVTKTPLSRRRKIYEAYDDFLRDAGVKIPSQLLTKLDEVPREYVVPFFARVCVLDTMDSSRYIRGTDQLEDERIRICQALAVLDPQAAHVYREEANALLGRAAVREIFKHVDHGRIYVNTQGIRESLEESFDRNFVRFLSLSRLEGYLRIAPRDDKLSATLQQAGLGSKRLNDAALQLLADLFTDIVRRYVSSDEYGLDSFLSTRVRHGVVSGQIRGLLENHHLITQRPKSDAPYDRNAYWLARITEDYGSSVSERCTRAFQEVSEEIDALVNDFRLTKLRIRSQEYPGAFFDYSFNESEIRRLYEKSIVLSDAEGFIDLLFETLWERTTANLQATVSYIRHELQEALLQRLQHLETRLTSVGVPGGSDVVSAIRSCRTGLANELEVIADWFRVVPTTELPAFLVSDACTTLVEKLKRILPTYHPTITLRPDKGARLRGSALLSFFDMLLILMDNAVRHAGRADPDVTLVVRVSEFIEIEVRNSLTENQSLAAIAVENLNVPAAEWKGSNVKVEGKSGLHKLRKILHYDLSLGVDYQTSARIEDGVLVVNVRMPLEGLSV